MDGYYVLGVIAIPYLGFGCIITVVSKEEEISSRALKIVHNALALTLQKCHQWQWRKRVNGFLAKVCTMFFIFVQG